MPVGNCPEQRVSELAVCDETGVIGIVSKTALEQALDGRQTQRLTELVRGPEFPHLHADQSLHLALERLGRAGVDVLPVVSRADVHKMEGVLLLRDVLKAYGIKQP